MSETPNYLTAEAVRTIHEQVLAAHGGMTGVRDESLLESAVAAPEATMTGVTLISEPVEIAAAYLFYICSSHAFLDGNKRTALASCLLFLKLNALLPGGPLPVDEWEAMVLAVAAGNLSREQTTARLRELLGQLR